MSERIVCIQAYFPDGGPGERKYAVYFSPDYQDLQESLDRETALRIARELFEEDGDTVVFDHSGGDHVRIASHSPDKVEEMRHHWKPLNLKVDPLVWEESL